MFLILLLFLSPCAQALHNIYSDPTQKYVYAENDFAEITGLLKQSGWQWSDLGKQKLAASQQIQIYAINTTVSADLLAQDMATKFKHILQQVQFVKGVYVLSGLYKNQHILAQVYPVNKSAARAYLSILGQSNNPDYLHKLLPLDRQNLVSFDTVKHNKFALLRVNMPVTELYFYIQQQLGKNQLESAEYMHIKNKIKAKAYFSINVDEKPYGKIQIFVTAKANNSLVAIIYPDRRLP